MNTFRWYVYELIDPRDGLAFYVGKGTGDRISAHERDARANPTVCSEKFSKIKDIWSVGLEVKRLHVAWFRDERAAYAHEAERVGEYGLDALTNIIPGGGGVRGSFIRRPRVEWSPMEAAQALVKSGSGLQWFLVWLRGSTSGAQEVHLTGVNSAVRSVLQAGFRSLFPSMWEKLKKSREALEFVAPYFAKHGVELDLGRA
jgi:hypothetical protein